jgi:rhamnulokinase
MGLWLLQECRRQWGREGREYGYAELVTLAAGEPGGASVVNPDHADFVAPGDMPARIRAYCARTGQPVPDSVAAVARCVLDSLALRYRMAFEDLGEVTGTRVPAVHIVGGGSRNALLNQLTADVSGLPVVTGPVEATALGNVLVQLHALGDLAGLDEMREVVRHGERPGLVEPAGDTGRFDDLYRRFTGWVAADLAAAGIGD